MRTERYEVHKTGGRIEHGKERVLAIEVRIDSKRDRDGLRHASAYVVQVPRAGRKICGSGRGGDVRGAVAAALETLTDTVMIPDRR